MRIRLYGRQPEATPQAGVPLRISWELAFENLSQLPRMFAEPDGSFLWTGQSQGNSWQLEGTLFDDGQIVRRIELVGNCATADWQLFLAALECDWSDIAVESLAENNVFDGQWLADRALDGSMA